ncbi:hypothetical protein HHI36_014797 [Cryptolaemus montrouzieri]|uniref:Uncharacterized protein n=1 Tax=Cryptolaemus montrouzieri TaxID=559131 RepID=A0ABD2N4V2_9CUCU
MGVDTERKKEGFELLQYDLKSAGDHKNQPFPESYVPSSKQSGQLEMHVKQCSSKTFSESAPEYEIVNLTQVDLFEEFKTTIAKMRKVLNVLEEKKSLKNIIEQNMSNKVLNTSMKLEKSQYHKCIVYHITKHKHAIDRCVGTPILAASKGNVVMRNTFSALHFGPIHEFHIRLNKHEIEGKRNMEFKFNHRLIDSKKHMLVETLPKQKSTTLFNNQECLDPVHEDFIIDVKLNLV